jgi:spore coat-associated protein N
MSLKKKLGLGVASAALGLSLVGGGTYAYFSDTAVQTSTFASGTLDLNVDPTTLITLDKFKPGDWKNQTFKLINNGNLDIKSVNLKTAYSVTKNDGSSVDPALAEKYADAIEVVFLRNVGDGNIITGDFPNQVVSRKSLKQLASMNPDDLAAEWDRTGIVRWALRDGLTAKGTGKESIDDFSVQFQFKNTPNAPQNDLQNLKLNLTWMFEGIQKDGEER